LTEKSKKLLDPADLDLITRTVIGEASNQDIIGQLAVAHVIKNRLVSGRYGRDARQVLFAPKQFEPWSTRRDELMGYRTDDPAYRRARMAVEAAFSGELDDPTGGATHFQNERVVRERGNVNGLAWLEDMKRNGSARVIGDHIFGRPDSQPGAGPRDDLAATSFPASINQSEKGSAAATAPHSELLRLLTGGSAPQRTPAGAEISGLIGSILADVAPQPEGQGHAVVPRDEDAGVPGVGAGPHPAPLHLLEQLKLPSLV
jgi:hypothetical protein